MAIEEKLSKRLNDFVIRVQELADVLPHGMEGQAVGIELRAAIARLQAAIARLEAANPGDAERRMTEVQGAVAECWRWLRLISAARLVQSIRLDELLIECKGLSENLTAGKESGRTPAPEREKCARRAPAARARVRESARPRNSRPGVAA